MITLKPYENRKKKLAHIPKDVRGLMENIRFCDVDLFTELG